MVYPFDTPTYYLRDDKAINTISQDAAMSNVKKTKHAIALFSQLL